MYVTLKNRLIAQFADSETTKLKMLLSELELGDKKPSNLLREMRSLANSSMNDDLLASLWLQRLPSQVQAILSTSSEPLEKLSIMADKICEVSIVPEINNVKVVKDKTQSSLEEKVDFLTKSLLKLQSSLNINNNYRRTNQKFSRSRSNSRSNRNTTQNTTNKRLCWYHDKFGVNATKCKPPCDYESTHNSNTEN